MNERADQKIIYGISSVANGSNKQPGIRWMINDHKKGINKCWKECRGKYYIGEVFVRKNKIWKKVFKLNIW